MSVRHDIRRLAFFKYLIGDGVTLEQATSEAGRELAQRRKQRALERPAASSSPIGGLRAQLIAKLLGGVGRTREPPPPRSHVKNPVAEPAHAVAAPLVAVPKTETDVVIGVWTGGTTGPTRLDDELPCHHPVTAAWQASIEANRKRLGDRYT
jgi:hypothetical protein